MKKEDCVRYKVYKVAESGQFGKNEHLVGQIADLLVESFSPDLRGKDRLGQVKDWERSLTSKENFGGYVFYAAIVGNEVIGFISSRQYGSSRRMQISNLCVKDECKKLGISRSLIEMVEKDNPDIDKIDLKCMGRNVDLYKRLGFKVFGFYWNKITDFIDCSEKPPKVEECIDPVDKKEYEKFIDVEDEVDEGECDEDFGDKEVTTYKCRVYWMEKIVKR